MISNSEQDELIAVYQDATNVIAFIKNQEWKVCYYILLIYAAIITLANLIAEKYIYLSKYLFWIFFIINAIAWVFGQYIIEESNEKLKSKRKRLENIYNNFSLRTRKIVNYQPSNKKTFYGLFATTLLIGYFLTTSMLFIVLI